MGGGMVWAMADEDKKTGLSGGLGDLVKAESMIQVALVLPIACGIGWLVGSQLDKHFGTSWMMIVGILLGAAAGFIQMFRTASSFLKRGK